MDKIKLIISLIAMTFSFMANGNANLSPMLLAKANSAIDENAVFSLRTNGVILRSDSEPMVFHANVSEAGTLAQVIGDKLYEIDEIEVVGPINDVDFNTLWQSSFNGHLKVINLENAIIADGIIPDQALFHIDEQVDWSTLIITTTWLEELILPEGVTEIGEFAVAYAIDLNYLKLPSTVKKIGKSAFTDCIKFSPEVFTLPADLEHIESQAFYECRSLEGEVILPDGLISIKDAAFYHTRIGKVNFPGSLEYIGSMAFTGCKLQSIFLPDDCWLEWTGHQFYNNIELTEVHLPENATFIPEGIFNGCMSLEIVNIPQSIERIGEFAFSDCAITDVHLPETLKRIDIDAFQSCRKLKTIVLPSSLTVIETNAFNLCGGLRSVYCKATTPPECIASGIETEIIDPFSQIDKTIPLYVPIGTKNAYKAATGWNTFQNIIETDDFPWASLDEIRVDIHDGNNTIYDLQGRVIQNPSPGQICIVNGYKIIAK